MIDDEIVAVMKPFVKLLGLKHFSRFIVTFVFVFLWTLKNKNNKRIIVMHGVQSCKLWGVLLGQAVLPSTTISYLTDNIGLPLQWEGNIIKKLRQIDVKLMLAGLKRVTGIIAMTKKLADELAPGRPYIIIPSIQNSYWTFPNISLPSRDKAEFTIVYAGGLFVEYGINLLIDAFIRANRSNWRLKIAGSGNMSDAVQDICKKEPRIDYLGFLNATQLSNFMIWLTCW